MWCGVDWKIWDVMGSKICDHVFFFLRRRRTNKRRPTLLLLLLPPPTICSLSVSVSVRTPMLYRRQTHMHMRTSIICFISSLRFVSSHAPPQKKIHRLHSAFSPARIHTYALTHPTCNSGHPTCNSDHPTCDSDHPTCDSDVLPIPDSRFPSLLPARYPPPPAYHSLAVPLCVYDPAPVPSHRSLVRFLPAR